MGNIIYTQPNEGTPLLQIINCSSDIIQLRYAASIELITVQPNITIVNKMYSQKLMIECEGHPQHIKKYYTRR
jgi:hypothetical protein